jgi:hypothetical protein
LVKFPDEELAKVALVPAGGFVNPLSVSVSIKTLLVPPVAIAWISPPRVKFAGRGLPGKLLAPPSSVNWYRDPAAARKLLMVPSAPVPG